MAEGHLPEWTTPSGHHQGWVSNTPQQTGIYLFQLIADNRVLTTRSWMINQ
jgi:hypothetical protein